METGEASAPLRHERGAVTCADPLAQLEQELSRRGLLLQHDRELPSATSLVTGEPIAGSWWGHPLGDRIYALLVAFERGSGELVVKLVNGKLTYVHRRLWPALVTLALHRPAARAARVSPLARSLLDRVAREGLLRCDELAASGFAPARELARAARELEGELLVHSDSLHGSGGAHVKQLSDWRRWSDEHELEPLRSSSEARRELEAAVRALVDAAPRQPRVPLLDA